HGERRRYPGNGRSTGPRPGAPVEPCHAGQYPAEPGLRLRLQCAGSAGRGGGAVSVLWPPAEPHAGRRAHEPELGLGHCQRPAAAPCAASMTASSTTGARAPRRGGQEENFDMKPTASTGSLPGAWIILALALGATALLLAGGCKTSQRATGGHIAELQ